VRVLDIPGPQVFETDPSAGSLDPPTGRYSYLSRTAQTNRSQQLLWRLLDASTLVDHLLWPESWPCRSKTC